MTYDCVYLLFYHEDVKVQLLIILHVNTLFHCKLINIYYYIVICVATKVQTKHRFIYDVVFFNSVLGMLLCRTCELLSWESWSVCTSSCGDRTRKRAICCNTDWSLDVCLLHCGRSRSDLSDTQSCGYECVFQLCVLP